MKILPLCALLAVLPGTIGAADLTVTHSPSPGDFILAAEKNAGGIVVADTENPAVRRAAEDLAEDFARVTGSRATVASDFSAPEKIRILAGTLGQNKLIDQLAAAGRLATNGISGAWESYVLQIVNQPLAGVDRALVIAGSDRRGTIFGLYQLSEMIGVSPWYWWADVPVTPASTLALHGDFFRQGPPAVKYRGIFLNDEDFGLRPWAAKTFEPETKNIGPKTYTKVFELLLRLHANYLWPAMHAGSAAFNSFPTNREIADRFGIVMGSAHCEQMLRNNVSEWNGRTNGEYNFVTNPDGVLRYWEQRVRENGKFDNTYTVGMRGIHDGAMPGTGTPAEKATRLHTIIAEQRAMLARHVNPDPARVPQIFCPYKEVLELYRLAPEIPDDISLVWPDDNYGYIRQFSNAHERQRSGSAGVYYHISYWGMPYNYLWLNTTPPALIAEEMVKAFDYGANRVWILNVGDLKPGELGTEFFLKLAWNPHAWNGTNAGDLLATSLARDFGSTLAPELTAILADYYRLSFQRKPEHIGFPTNTVFSAQMNGDEAGRRLAEWQQLSARTAVAATKLAPPAQDAFFELIGYPVQAAAAMNVKHLAQTKYFSGLRQGRRNLEPFAEAAQNAFTEITRLTDRYNNEIAGGKWKLMMSSHPGGQPVFGAPKIPAPEIPFAPARLGLAVDGDETAYFANATNHAGGRLPEFNVLTPCSHFVDVFNGGAGTLAWTARPAADWIQLSVPGGTGEARTQVSIDWNRAPKGAEVQSKIIFTAGAEKIPVTVSVFNPAETNFAAGADFIEENHRVVITAAHASAFVAGRDAAWQTISDLGYQGRAVGVFPVTVAVRATPEKILAESPQLQFNVCLRHAGDWRVTVRALPTFSVETGQPQRYAIALDDAPPQIVALPDSQSERDPQWQENVLRNAALTTSAHHLATAGRHTLKIWMVDPGIVLDTIAAETGDQQRLGYVWPEETRIVR